MQRTIIFTVLFSAAVLASAGEMKGMDMKGMDMKDMSPSAMGKGDRAAKHSAKGIVKSVDRANSSVVLDHEPVSSLKWPAMTMKFKVQDTAVLGKLGEGRKVEVEFEQRGKDYVITGVK